ncbi:serine/threonine-protein kinase [Paenibacillus shenyangensis]|uniref:serine/threonine-protein kinase n=1 Tax=Paenibacillus sp. A9 TaxID=1284352 RepID=UPI000378B96E|nr:serine/threonine-protein kinase [Paenibacillus sp. A9]
MTTPATIREILTNLSLSLGEEIGGEGANSQAFLAYDPQLDSEIVVKVVPKATFTDQNKYFQESKLLYSSRHPNVMVINFASQDDDNIYMSMPYYSQGSLNKLINTRYLRAREVIKYALDFLSGIHYIHTRGLIHFDVKPTNILINDSSQAVLTDFGLTNYIDLSGFSRPSALYLAHQAPESLKGIPLTVQHDVYQAGLTLYRMCNGNEIFEEQRQISTRADILNGNFPNRERFLPHIPRKLRGIVKKALELDPANRYQTVLALMNDLGKLDEHLDWYYEKLPDSEIWSRQNDTARFTITLLQDNGFWKSTGQKLTFSSGRSTRISAAFGTYADRQVAENKIQQLLKKI